MTAEIPRELRGLRHFLAIRDIDGATLAALVAFAIRRKADFRAGRLERRFGGRVLAMIFQKASLRTRLGFEAAMAQLGGHAICLEDMQVGLTRREDVRDVARVIASMCDAIMARVYGHQLVVELATHSSVPVINGLSDWAHPCQALADVMTIHEHFGRWEGLRVAYVGDANNVARSLLSACARLGMDFIAASPPGYSLDGGLLASARMIAQQKGATVAQVQEPAEAVRGADVVYTDVWTSMGQENEAEKRRSDFAGYQVDAALVRLARPQAIVMHCLPAHRGEEITDEVLDGPQSVVFQQAENRLHSQRALLEVLLEAPRGAGAGGPPAPAARPGKPGEQNGEG